MIFYLGFHYDTASSLFQRTLACFLSLEFWSSKSFWPYTYSAGVHLRINACITHCDEDINKSLVHCLQEGLLNILRGHFSVLKCTGLTCPFQCLPLELESKEIIRREESVLEPGNHRHVCLTMHLLNSHTFHCTVQSMPSIISIRVLCFVNKHMHNIRSVLWISMNYISFEGRNTWQSKLLTVWHSGLQEQ